MAKKESAFMSAFALSGSGNAWGHSPLDSIRAKYVDESPRKGKLALPKLFISIPEEFRARRPVGETGFLCGQRPVWK